MRIITKLLVGFMVICMVPLGAVETASRLGESQPEGFGRYGKWAALYERLGAPCDGCVATMAVAFEGCFEQGPSFLPKGKTWQDVIGIGLISKALSQNEPTIFESSASAKAALLGAVTTELTDLTEARNPHAFQDRVLLWQVGKALDPNFLKMKDEDDPTGLGAEWMLLLGAVETARPLEESQPEGFSRYGKWAAFYEELGAPCDGRVATMAVAFEGCFQGKKPLLPQRKTWKDIIGIGLIAKTLSQNEPTIFESHASAKQALVSALTTELWQLTQRNNPHAFEHKEILWEVGQTLRPDFVKMVNDYDPTGLGHEMLTCFAEALWLALCNIFCPMPWFA